MFWGAFTVHGPGALQPVEGMMNLEAYIEVLRIKLVPLLDKHFPRGDATFQQDLAPCHTSRKVKQFVLDNDIRTLDWPGNSPDLNPIENLWAILKARLHKHDCTTRVKLVAAIIEIWFHDDEIGQMCENLVF